MKLLKILGLTILFNLVSFSVDAQTTSILSGPPCAYVDCSVNSIVARGANLTDTGIAGGIAVIRSVVAPSTTLVIENDNVNHFPVVNLGEDSGHNGQIKVLDSGGSNRVLIGQNSGFSQIQFNDPTNQAFITQNTGTAGSLQLGSGDNAAPVAQTLSVQSAASVSNTNGANTTIDLSAGTGTGTGGNLVINGAPHSTTGSSKNAYSAIMTFNGDTLQTVTSTGGTAAAPALAILNPNTGLYSTSTGANLGLSVGGAVKEDYAITTAATWTLNAATTINSATFKVTTLAAATAVDTVCYSTATGLFTEEPTGTTCTVSARRFKRDIHYLSDAHMLDEVLGMKPVSFRFKKGVGQDDGVEVHYGLIAEDVAKVAPELVAYEKDGQTHGVKYGDGELQSHLIGAIKAEQEEINDLKNKSVSLSSEVCLGKLCIGWK